MDRFSLIQKYKKKLIAITIVIIGLILFLFLFDEQAWLNQLDRDAVYLDVDSVHRTVEEKQKFKELKQAFLSQWLDTSNCFMEDFQTGEDPNTGLTKVIDVYVDNVLYTPTYDSVVVLVAFYVAWSGDYDNKFVIMKATIDSLGKWNFDCNHYNDWVSSKGKNNLEFLSKKFRRTILTMDILDENKKIKPDFIHRLFIGKLEEKIPIRESWLDRLLKKIPQSGPVH